MTYTLKAEVTSKVACGLESSHCLKSAGRDCLQAESGQTHASFYGGFRQMGDKQHRFVQKSRAAWQGPILFLFLYCPGARQRRRLQHIQPFWRAPAPSLHWNCLCAVLVIACMTYRSA